MVGAHTLDRLTARVHRRRDPHSWHTQGSLVLWICPSCLKPPLLRWKLEMQGFHQEGAALTPFQAKRRAPGSPAPDKWEESHGWPGTTVSRPRPRHVSGSPTTPALPLGGGWSPPWSNSQWGPAPWQRARSECARFHVPPRGSGPAGRRERGEGQGPLGRSRRKQKARLGEGEESSWKDRALRRGRGEREEALRASAAWLLSGFIIYRILIARNRLQL